MTTRADQFLGSQAEKERLARERVVAGWVAALESAERTAAAAEGAKVRLYQVNYRVKSETSRTKGAEKARREALWALLRALKPVERHISTSTWIARLHIKEATALSNLLAPPLDPAMDFLAVAELTANRTRLGDADLQS